MSTGDTIDDSKLSQIRSLIDSLPEGRLRASLQDALVTSTSDPGSRSSAEGTSRASTTADYEEGSILALIKHHGTPDSLPHGATYLTYFTHLFHSILYALGYAPTKEFSGVEDSQFEFEGTDEHKSILFEDKTSSAHRFYLAVVAMGTSMVLLFHPASYANSVSWHSLSLPLHHFVASWESEAPTPLTPYPMQTLRSLGKKSSSEPIINALKDVLEKVRTSNNSGHGNSSNCGGGAGGGPSASLGRSNDSLTRPSQRDGHPSSSLMGVPQPLTGMRGDFDRDLYPDFGASVPGALIGGGGNGGGGAPFNRTVHPGSQVGPDHPMFGGHGEFGSGSARRPDLGPRPPYVPQGARFDPVFPAGVQPPEGFHPPGGLHPLPGRGDMRPGGPPRGPPMGPAPDHLRPPPNNQFGPHFGW